MEKEKKTFTTDEIAEMLNCTSTSVRNIVRYYHIDYIKEPNNKGCIKVSYSQESLNQIKEHYNARRVKAKQRVISLTDTEEVDSPEEHTLVTDKRCFDLNWWPDTVPSCFQEQRCFMEFGQMNVKTEERIKSVIKKLENREMTTAEVKQEYKMTRSEFLSFMNTLTYCSRVYEYRVGNRVYLGLLKRWEDE